MRKVRLWQIWDWQSILKSIFVIVSFSFALYFLFNFSGWVRSLHSSNMTTAVDGRIISIKDIPERIQGKMGSSTRVIGKEIEYTFLIGIINYRNTDRIPNSFNNNSFFESLSKDPNRLLRIKYNPADPRESQIDTEN